jgi:hypothetical protein
LLLLEPVDGAETPQDTAPTIRPLHRRRQSHLSAFPNSLLNIPPRFFARSPTQPTPPGDRRIDVRRDRSRQPVLQKPSTVSTASREAFRRESSLFRRELDP